MIEVIPAIDIIDGKCVRLVQGDYAEKKVYNENPLEVAKSFEGAGLKRLHLVDLDGAKAKHVVNLKVLADIAAHTGLTIDFGGGIKSDEDIEKVFNNGAAMATVGSVAVTNPCAFDTWVDKYGSEKIILGADVKDYKIAITGWLDTTNTDLFDFIIEKRQQGINKVLCTDISKDGMLDGPAFELYRSLINMFSDIYLIASGGVSGIADIDRLVELRVPAVVIGKAIYENRITLEELKKYL